MKKKSKTDFEIDIYPNGKMIVRHFTLIDIIVSKIRYFFKIGWYHIKLTKENHEEK